MAERTQHDGHDQVRRIVRLSADRDAVWAEIGGFDRIADWHPLIARAELVEIEGETYRHLGTVDGDRFMERLIETGPHHVTYETIDGPLPGEDHRATLSCVAEPGGCHVYWSAYFAPVGGEGHLADEIIGKFYEIGLQALADRYAAPDAAGELRGIQPE